MLTFVNSILAPESVEIEADETGINDLIDNLKYVLKSKDHIHLNIDSELDYADIPDKQKSNYKSVKLVTIRYLDKK